MSRSITYYLLLIFTVIYTQSCKDKCENISCQNSGICIDGTCNCPIGYSGETCEIDDLCRGLTCPYDGECDKGECTCTELTQNYLVGNWKFEPSGSIITFNSDGSFDAGGGFVQSYELDTSTNKIYIYDLNNEVFHTYHPIVESLTCNVMNFYSEEFDVITPLVRL